MLKDIEIRNFKSLKHLKYKCAKLNLLTGLNGSGKSSFIQALRFIKAFSKESGGGVSSRTSVDLYGESLQIGTYRDLLYCHAGPKRAQRVASIAAASIESPLPVTLEIQPSPSAYRGTYMDEAKAFVRFVEGDLSTSALRNWLSSKKLCTDQKFIERSDLLMEALREVSISNYLSADRGSPHSIHSFSSEMSTTFGADGRDAVSQLTHWWGLVLDPWACRTDCKSEFLIDQLDAWLNVVSPGAHVEFKRIPELSTVALSYSYGTGKGAMKFRPQNVGFGLSYVLPMLLVLLTANPGDSIVLENPEAHLHPRGQAEIGKLLAQVAGAGIQLFVETHSDHVINGIRVAVKDKVVKPEDVNIAFFERGEHVISEDTHVPKTEIYSSERDIKIDGKGSLSEYPDGFLDEWGNQLMELLR